MSEKNPENNQIPEGPKSPHDNENKEVRESPEQKEKREAAERKEKEERPEEQEKAEWLLEHDWLSPEKNHNTSESRSNVPEKNPFPGVPVDKGVNYFTQDAPGITGLAKGVFDSAAMTGKLALDTVADTARLVFRPVREIQRTRAYLKSLDEAETKV